MAKTLDGLSRIAISGSSASRDESLERDRVERAHVETVTGLPDHVAIETSNRFGNGLV
jgi:hypothetical protein